MSLFQSPRWPPTAFTVDSTQLRSGGLLLGAVCTKENKNVVWSLIPNGDAGEIVLMEMQDSFGVVQGGWRPGGRASAADPCRQGPADAFYQENRLFGQNTHIFCCETRQWVRFRSQVVFKLAAQPGRAATWRPHDRGCAPAADRQAKFNKFYYTILSEVLIVWEHATQHTRTRHV